MSATILKLPSILDIQACSEMQSAISERLAAQQELVLDAADVERISTPAIQLLIVSIQAASARAKQLEIMLPSRVLTQAIDDLGLTAEFTPHITSGEKIL